LAVLKNNSPEENVSCIASGTAESTGIWVVSIGVEEIMSLKYIAQVSYVFLFLRVQV
jgi:hypothetical protein